MEKLRAVETCLCAQASAARDFPVWVSACVDVAQSVGPTERPFAGYAIERWKSSWFLFHCPVRMSRWTAVLGPTASNRFNSVGCKCELRNVSWCRCAVEQSDQEKPQSSSSRSDCILHGQPI